jgi:hypothetical protein
MKPRIIFESYGTTEAVLFPSINAALKCRSSTYQRLWASRVLSNLFRHNRAEGGEQAVDFFWGVVVDEADAEEAPGTFDVEALG